MAKDSVNMNDLDAVDEDAQFSVMLDQVSLLDQIESIMEVERSGNKLEAFKQYVAVGDQLQKMLGGANPSQFNVITKQLDFVMSRVENLSSEVEEREEIVRQESEQALMQDAFLSMKRARELEDEGNIAEALEVHMHAGEVLIEALKWTRNENLRSIISQSIEQCLGRVELLREYRLYAPEKFLPKPIQDENAKKIVDISKQPDSLLNWESFDPNVCVRILSFLSISELSGLFTVCMDWRRILKSPRLQNLWKNIVLGDLPTQDVLGHGPSLEWFMESNLTDYVERLTISLGSLDAGSWMDHQDCLKLVHTPLLKLRSLLFITTYLETPNLIIAKFENLTELFLETPVDLTEVAEFMPSLRCFHCSTLNLETFQPKSIHKNLQYLSFIYGVNAINLNLIFHCFPNLLFLALEVDQPIIHLAQCLQYTNLEVLNLSWNRETFWKNRTGKTISEEEGLEWFKQIQVPRLILDLDYVLQGGRALQTVLSECMPDSIIEISGTAHLTSYKTFIKYSNEYKDRNR